MMDGINGLHASHEHPLLLFSSLRYTGAGFLPLVRIIVKSANKGGNSELTYAPGSGVSFGLQTYKLTSLQGGYFQCIILWAFIRMSLQDMDKDVTVTFCAEPCPTSASYLSWLKVLFWCGYPPFSCISQAHTSHLSTFQLVSFSQLAFCHEYPVDC